MASKFKRATAYVSANKDVKVDQETQLAFYGLFKCATVGLALEKGSKPSMFDFAGQAKYAAWSALGNLGQDEAKDRYCQLVSRVFGSRWDGLASDASGPPRAASAGGGGGGGKGWDFFQGQEVREAASKRHEFWDKQPMPNKFNEDSPEHMTPELIDAHILDHQSSQELALDPSLGLEWCLDAWNDLSLEEICEQVHRLSKHGEQGEVMSFSPSMDFLVWSMDPPGMKRRHLTGLRRIETRELVGFICGLPMSYSVEEHTEKESFEIKNLFVHPEMRGNRLAPLLIAEATRKAVLDGYYSALYTSSVTITKPLCKARFYLRPLNMARLVATRFKQISRGQTLARLDQRYSVSAPLPKGWQRMDSTTVDKAYELLEQFSTSFKVRGKLSREQFRYWFLDGHSSVHAYVIVDSELNSVVGFTSWHILSANVESNAGFPTVLSAAFGNYCAVSKSAKEDRETLLRTLYDAQVAQLVLDEVDVMMMLDIGGWEDVLLDFQYSKAEVTPEYLLYHLYNFKALPCDTEDFNIYFF